MQQLAKAEGNILENELLLKSLNETKASSTVITTSLEQFKQMETSLDKVLYRLILNVILILLLLKNDIKRADYGCI